VLDRPPHPDPGHDLRWRRPSDLLPATARGGRADRAPLDGSHPRRADRGGHHALLGDLRGRAAALGPAAVGAHEGAGGARHGRAARRRRRARARAVHDHRDGPGARAHARRAPGLGAALAAL
ncbi:MAG: Transcriptional regulator, HxlR family, partial [uncultured Solirubrobacteraceae bacterium]